jgi:hypothetical protein
MNASMEPQKGVLAVSARLEGTCFLAEWLVLSVSCRNHDVASLADSDQNLGLTCPVRIVFRGIAMPSSVPVGGDRITVKIYSPGESTSVVKYNLAAHRSPLNLRFHALIGLPSHMICIHAWWSITRK